MTTGETARADEQLEGLRAGLRLLALRSLGSIPAAEEAAQETLARAVEALQDGRPRDPEHIAAFVHGIAQHVIADACRERKRVVPLESVPEAAVVSGSGDTLSALISTAEQEAVRAALGRLSPADRQLLRLAFFEGLTPAQIAARLGEPPERIRKRKSRAMERLRAAFLGATAGHEPEGSTT